MIKRIDLKKAIHTVAIIALITIIGFSIADCESGGEGGGGTENLITIGNFSWHVFSDLNEGGKSTIRMEKEGSDKITFKGSVGFIEESVESEKHYGYAGAEADPNNEARDALRATDYLSFNHKGDGNNYKIIAITSDVDDGNYFYTTFNTGDIEQEAMIWYSYFQKDGDNSRIDPSKILSITFQAAAELEQGKFSFTIWNLQPGPSIVKQAQDLLLKEFKDGRPVVMGNLTAAGILEEDDSNGFTNYFHYFTNAYNEAILKKDNNMELFLSENDDTSYYNLTTFVQNLAKEDSNILEDVTYEELLNMIDSWKEKLVEISVDEYWANYIDSIKNGGGGEPQD